MSSAFLSAAARRRSRPVVARPGAGSSNVWARSSMPVRKQSAPATIVTSTTPIARSAFFSDPQPSAASRRWAAPVAVAVVDDLGLGRRRSPGRCRSGSPGRRPARPGRRSAARARPRRCRSGSRRAAATRPRPSSAPGTRRGRSARRRRTRGSKRSPPPVVTDSTGRLSVRRSCARATVTSGAELRALPDRGPARSDAWRSRREPTVEHVLHGHEPVELAPGLRASRAAAAASAGREALLARGDDARRDVSSNCTGRCEVRPGPVPPGPSAAVSDRVVELNGLHDPDAQQVLDGRRQQARGPRRSGRSASACGPSDGTSTCVARREQQDRRRRRGRAPARTSRSSRPSAPRWPRSSVSGAAPRPPPALPPCRAPVSPSSLGTDRRADEDASSASSTATAGMSTNQNRRRSARARRRLAAAGRRRPAPSALVACGRFAGTGLRPGVPGGAGRAPARRSTEPPGRCAISGECRGRDPAMNRTTAGGVEPVDREALGDPAPDLGRRRRRAAGS